MNTGFKPGKNKAAKGEGWAWASICFATNTKGPYKPHCLPGYLAVGNLHLFLLPWKHIRSREVASLGKNGGETEVYLYPDTFKVFGIAHNLNHQPSKVPR